MNPFSVNSSSGMPIIQVVEDGAVNRVLFGSTSGFDVSVAEGDVSVSKALSVGNNLSVGGNVIIDGTLDSNIIIANTLSAINLTASGTVTANTLSATDTDATLTNLGGGAAGKAIFGAATATGTGVPVLATSPTLTTPNIGTATCANIVLLTNGNISGGAGGGQGGIFNAGGAVSTWSSVSCSLGRDAFIGFSSSPNYTAYTSNNLDTRITRQSAGVLRVGTTSSNASGSLLLTNLTASGTVKANTLSATDINSTLRITGTFLSEDNVIEIATATVTLNYANHSGRYIRLTHTDGPITIVLDDATSVSPKGAEYFFFKATNQAISFTGATVNGDTRIGDVVQNSGFALKCVVGGSSAFDLI
jgi:uncharacterized protein with GYD domain